MAEGEGVRIYDDSIGIRAGGRNGLVWRAPEAAHSRGSVYEVDTTEIVRVMKRRGYLESLGFLSDSDEEE